MSVPLPRRLKDAIASGLVRKESFDFNLLSDIQKNRWLDLSVSHAKPGDIAKVGPWVRGKRTVCYYDRNLDPTDCVTETREASKHKDSSKRKES